MKAKSGTQQSIIAGMLLRRVSRKSFALAPSSPIFSFTCFSIQIPKGVFFSPGGPMVKWNGALTSGVGVAMGGIGGTTGAGTAVESDVGGGITGAGTSGMAMSGILGRR